MVILLDSCDGDALALALALQREGHDVAIAIDKDDSQLVGEGLVEHIHDPLSWAREYDPDLILFDMVGKGGEADVLRDDGFAVHGGGRALDILELDRLQGLRIFQGLGLRIPETECFEDADFDRAIAHVQQDGGRWVFKPCGNIGNDKTFVAEDAEDMAEFIEAQRDQASGEDIKFPAFVLQRFVPGIEVSIERVYSQGQPVPGMDSLTFEEKKFLAGNLGPAVGCAGNLVLDAPERFTAITTQLVDRYALAHRLNAFVDLNTIVDPETGVPYILEATARFGYAALWANLARWRMPLGETFLALAEGEPVETHIVPQMAAAVVVSVPPYPLGDCHMIRNHPVVDDIVGDPHLWPYDVMLADDGTLKIAGAEGLIYTVTGLGQTPASAYDACYRWLADARLPDRQYRVDLAERVTGDLPRLQALGYTLPR